MIPAFFEVNLLLAISNQMKTIKKDHTKNFNNNILSSEIIYDKSVRWVTSQWLLFLFAILYLPTQISCQTLKQKTSVFTIPQYYLLQPEQIPEFWINSEEEVSQFLSTKVHKGKVSVIGHSAGGRPIRAVFYGQPRKQNGTTTFSGSLGYGNVHTFRGSDHDKIVYLGIGGIHGGRI